MIADFCEESFNVIGEVSVFMADGRVFTSSYPRVVWKWLQGKDWRNVSVYDSSFNYVYSWDRY